MKNENLEIVNLEINKFGASYLLKGLEELNKSGVTLQDSANIINLVNSINSKFAESENKTDNAE